MTATTAGRRRFRLAASAVSLAALMALTACSGDSEDQEVASAGDDIVVIPEGTPDDSGDAADDTPTEDTTEDATAEDVEPDDQGLAFAQCMRDNGIDMPDPTGTGEEAFMEAMQVFGDYDREVLRPALDACRDLLPAQATIEQRGPQDEETRLALTECMRDKGVEVPDDVWESGLPEDVDREEFRAALRECREETGVVREETGEGSAQQS
ncbi:hypothetical protein [Jiangella asiatica]|uniref:Secreted protein n=1 Tax=Jiangella asiatica TaxID=2530372 RepID=A0A4R5CP75_9ACTN|nr:hypothetical protein [Jiangella asiatica]TDE00571.1 hypothetical protein E1269_24985 [Jiangella asiatica]